MDEKQNITNPEQKIDSGTLNQLFARIYYGRLRFFYLSTTIIGYLLSLSFLALVSNKNSYYQIIPVAFLLTFVTLSIIFGLTWWRAVITKVKIKTLPALPNFTSDDVPEIHFELKTFHKNYRKFSTIDSVRNLFLFSGATMLFFLLYELSKITIDPMSTQTLTLRLSISGLLILIGLTLHLISYKFRWKEQTLQTES